MGPWSSKWSIKDENKLLNELGTGTDTATNPGGESLGAGGGREGSGGGTEPVAGNGTGSVPNSGSTNVYYDHTNFSGSAIATSTELYDSLGTISTISQAQTPHLYTSSIGSSIDGHLTQLTQLTIQDSKISQTMDGTNLSPYHTPESGAVAVSYIGMGAVGGEQSPQMDMQNESNAAPTAPHTPQGVDPALTVLQPPVAQPQVLTSTIPSYSTILPSFGHYTTGSGDFSYSAAYSQYSSTPYSGYSYGPTTGGLLNSTYYYCDGDSIPSSQNFNGGENALNLDCATATAVDVASRSPLAATRASSGASAASPTGSACTKPELSQTPSDLYIA
ncbi:uncharacterized protein LOC106638542 [Copidosoma floridanum]|uniref:uncharacterized protein LOC106638542 n=1 Tax=Copidosoma floridanum TaxID=29053 RepID=UPI000C6F9C67|nr:uncharacterized protein LOC106638542 [Copidosoma floridanum]